MSAIKIKKYSSPTCRPCAVLDGILADAGIMVDERINVFELNEEDLARLHLTSVPVLAFERGGVEVARLDGLVDAKTVQAKLSELEAK
jgi:hypothetical protein